MGIIGMRQPVFKGVRYDKTSTAATYKPGIDVAVLVAATAVLTYQP
jgi:hypothetical protein